MFRINDNKGFQIKLENGYMVSVQFGPGNYGSNYSLGFEEMGRPLLPVRKQLLLLQTAAS